MNEINNNESVCTSKDFAQNVIDSIGDPIIVIDPSNYKLLLANKAMSDQVKGVDLITGSMTCYQATHRRDTPCNPPDDPCPLKKVIATRSTVRVVHVHFDDKNNESIIDVVATPVLDKSGNVVQVIESFHDITHIMREKIALQKSEKMFKTLFNNTGDAILMHDMEGHFIEVNQVACAQLGYTRDELLKISPIDLNSPEYSKVVPDRIRKIRDDGHGIFETALVRKDGSTVPIELSSRMIEYAGEPTILSIARDITERKRTEEILKQYTEDLKDSNELKELFIDIMRHDVLNPAGIVKGYTEVLLNMEDNEKKIQALQKIMDNTERLINMIETAAKFAKLESIEELEFEKMDIAVIFKEVVENFRPQIEDKQITLEFKAKGTYPANVNTAIEEVFANLLSNAIKYGPQEGKIIIDMIDADDNWKVTVTDFGDGISDEDKTLLFERFKRVGKGSVKGTGLGLAIVRRIIELHDGSVGVEDNPAGAGCLFWVTVGKA